MEFNKTKSAGYLANHMARLFATGLHQRIRALGLAPAQFMTLLELWGGDGITQKELVKRLDVEQATMANTLSRMQRDGLIIRKSDKKDRRAQSVHLTPKARELEAEATAAAMAQNNLALSDLSQEEQQLFLDLMQRAISAMKSEELKD
jgi:DNA-binding MarR family transcriptional regulator